MVSRDGNKWILKSKIWVVASTRYATVNTRLTAMGSYGRETRRLLELILPNVEIYLLLKVCRDSRVSCSTHKKDSMLSHPIKLAILLITVPLILV